MEAQGEKLLQSLLDEEQQLLAKVDAAKKDAEQIIEDAKRKAAEIVQQAAARADRAAQERREQTDRDSDAARQQVLERTQQQIETQEQAASAKRDAAVMRILEQVLP